MTYPDGSLCARNNSIIGQLHTRRAGKHCHPVVGELQSDNYSLIHSCNNIRIHESHLMKGSLKKIHEFSGMVLKKSAS